MKRLTKEEFIERSTVIHNGKYDYSKVEYVNSTTKVCIICPIHGEFWQTPNSHLSGRGCPQCGGTQGQDTETFIRRAKELYGDKYDFSKVIYKNQRTKVKVICPTHGEFIQSPHTILGGICCPKCGFEKRRQRTLHKVEQFIESANKIHHNKYDYSNTIYNGSTCKVDIICHEKDENGDEHGVFKQTPNCHLRGRGCPKCGCNRVNIKEFIRRANNIHHNKYNYDKVVYTKITDKVCITCPQHGDFWQMAESHLHGVGCPKCGVIKNANNRRKLLSEFITEATHIHQGKYDYSKVNYVNYNTKVCIICPEHGEFWQTPHSHINGAGCDVCAHINTVMKQRSTRDEFIKKANIVHKGKYNYDLTNYTTAQSYVDIICPKHGIFTQTAHSHLRGAGCPICGNNLSRAEIELGDIIKEWGFDVERRTHNILNNGREIDIFVPSMKIGIEYNGIIWHSEELGKGKKYHLNKTEECEKQGIRLIHIFEDKWKKNKEITLSLLKNALCVENVVLSATDCKIEKVDDKIGLTFLSKNYIDGAVRAKLYYGLYYNNDLVSLLALSPKRGTSNKEWKLLCFCNRLNTKVDGAPLKLFECFIKEQQPTIVTAYSNRLWDNGETYKQLGFHFTHHTPPQIYATKSSKKENGIKENNASLSKFGQDIYHVYDCGFAQFEWETTQ